MSTDQSPTAGPKRSRRAEPITRREAKSGRVSYEFRADVGITPAGARDRRRFTYPTLAEAKREYRRITTEVAAGTYHRQVDLTVDQACDQWLAGRRGIRPVSLRGYVNDLKPVRRFLGGKKLQQLTKADGDALVEWMLTEGRTSPQHFQANSLAGQVVEFIAAHPGGVASAVIRTEFAGRDVHTCLSNLLTAGRVARLRRGVYGPATGAGGADSTAGRGGVKPVSVRSTLTRFTAVVQSFADQGVLPRNVIALVERPCDAMADHDGDTGKSWTVAEVQAFRESVRDHRLYAAWLLSCYGLRRSEVLGARWSDIDKGVLSIRRGRVAVDTEATGYVEGLPKSRRSRRDLPLPADVLAALHALKVTQKSEVLALGVPWSDDGLIAVHEDTAPVRHEWYSDEFHRLRERAGLRRIHLKGLRNTSVSLMLDQGHPVHIVAAWHGHDPAVALSIYSDAKADELRAVGEALFG